MNLALYLAAGVGVLYGAIWLITRLAQPPKLNRVSDSWLDHHKYDKRQHRPD